MKFDDSLARVQAWRDASKCPMCRAFCKSTTILNLPDPSFCELLVFSYPRALLNMSATFVRDVDYYSSKRQYNWCGPL